MLKFGNYYLNQSYSEIKEELEEISKEEYKIIPKTFSDEIIFRGKVNKDINFLGFSWNVVLGVVSGKIYKIALQYNSASFPFLPKEDLKIYKSAGNFLIENFGKPNKTQEYFSQWNLNWGNIILNQEKISDTFGGINLISTSNLPFNNSTTTSAAHSNNIKGLSYFARGKYDGVIACFTKMKKLLNNIFYFFILLLIVFLLSSGISMLIIPHHFFESGGLPLLKEEYQTLPLYIKIGSLLLPFSQIIFGLWGFFRLLSKRDRIICLILVVLLTIFYCFILVPDLDLHRTDLPPQELCLLELR